MNYRAMCEDFQFQERKKNEKAYLFPLCMCPQCVSAFAQTGTEIQVKFTPSMSHNSGQA
jgi:hypothetical protein